MAKRSLLKRVRPKKMARDGLVAGVVWYTPDAWASLRATAVDPERFEATFDDWLAMADAALRELSNAGVAPRKVLVDAKEFGAWCLRHHEKNEAAARSKYVSQWLRADDDAKRNA